MGAVSLMGHLIRVRGRDMTNMVCRMKLLQTIMIPNID